MAGRLFTVLAAVSLVLCLGTGALLARSYFVQSEREVRAFGTRWNTLLARGKLVLDDGPQRKWEADERVETAQAEAVAATAALERRIAEVERQFLAVVVPMPGGDDPFRQAIEDTDRKDKGLPPIPASVRKAKRDQADEAFRAESDRLEAQLRGLRFDEREAVSRHLVDALLANVGTAVPTRVFAVPVIPVPMALALLPTIWIVRRWQRARAARRKGFEVSVTESAPRATGSTGRTRAR